MVQPVAPAVKPQSRVRHAGGAIFVSGSHSIFCDDKQELLGPEYLMR